MRDLFEDVAGKSPLDPNEAARETMRRPLRRRFYKTAEVKEAAGGFAVTLDDKPLRTPARGRLLAPTRTLAEALAGEWLAQAEHIDPLAMPLTRLANSILDGVADRMPEVADDIVRYAASDMVLYRAEHPEGLVAAQNAAWDEIVQWASRTLGARFIQTTGIAPVRQPEPALAAIRAAFPDDPWRLGALHAATTLTGSALVALALAADLVDSARAWAAAHVDEDWNFKLWGEDPTVLARRAVRFRELEAATLVLRQGR